MSLYSQPETDINLNDGSSIYDSVLDFVTTPVISFLDILSIPGDYLRGALTGQFKRVGGRELLETWGLLDKADDSFKAAAAGFAAEVFIDPLFFFGSLTGLTKLGRTAKLATEQLDTINYLKKVKNTTALAGEEYALKIGHKSVPFKQAIVYDEAIADTEKAVNRTVNSLAPTRLEQVQAGQRGITVGIPFTGIEKQVAKPISIAYETVREQLGINQALAGLKNTKTAKLLDKVFINTPKTIVGKAFLQTQERAGGKAIREAQDLRVAVMADIEKSAKQLGLDNETILNEVTKAIELKTIDDLNMGRNVELNSLFNEMYGRQKQLLARQAKGELTLDHFASLVEANKQKYLIEREEVMKQFNMREAEIASNRGFINQLGDLTKQFIKDTKLSFEDQLGYVQTRGVFIQHNSDTEIAYLFHNLTPEGRTLLAQNKEFESLAREYAGLYFAPQHARTFKNMNVFEVNRYLKDKFGIPKTFKTNPFEIAESRKYLSEIQANTATNAAAIVQFVAEPRYVTDVATGVIKETPGVHIADLLKKANVSAIRNAKGELITWRHNIELSDLKTLLKNKGMDKVIPTDVYNDFLKVTGVHYGSNSKFLSYLDSFSDLSRTLLLAVPAHLTTNTAGNLMMNFISGVSVNAHFQAAKGILDLYARVNPNTYVGKIIKSLGLSVDKDIADKLVKFREFKQAGSTFIQELGERETAGLSLLDKTIGAIQTSKYSYVPVLNTFNNLSETISKFAHFIQRLDDGLDPANAIASVKKYLFDYGDITPIERAVGRRIFLFYTFARKNLPLAITETISNRRAYILGKTAYATDRHEDYLPQYVLETGNVYVGNDTFVDIRNPIFEANRLSAQGRGIRGVVDKLLSQTLPQYKALAEGFTGRSFFRGIPLEETRRTVPAATLIPGLGAKTFIDKSGKQVTNASNVELLNALRNLPTQRIVGSVTDFLNPEIKGFPSLIGFRTRVLPKEGREIRFKQTALTKILGREPTVRKYNKFFSIEEAEQAKVGALLEELEAVNKRSRIYSQSRQ